MLLRRLLNYSTLLLMLSIWIVSCQTTPDSVVQALTQVEQCIDVYPDSALKLLKQIPHPETFRSKAQADYGLLMTQAMDKNYIKPESDSLISLAVGYYGSHGDHPKEQGKAFFYYGRVMMEMNRPEDAMRYFLKSKEIFDGSKEYKMLGLISEEIGNLNWKQKVYKEALSNFQESYEYYVFSNEVLGISYALRNIGRVYLLDPSLSDSIALDYYKKALKIAHENNCISEYSILQEIGMTYRAKKEYKKSEYYFLKALQANTKSSPISETYLSLGYLYLLMDNLSEAESYLKMSLSSLDLYTKMSGYNTLYWLEKSRKNPWIAINYKEKADSLNDVLHNRDVLERLGDLQKKYDKEIMLKKNLQIKVRYQSIALCSIVLFFVAVSVGCFYYYKNRTNKKRIQEIEQEIIANNEEIDFCQQKIAEYERFKDISVDYQTKFGELNGKVFLLTQQNKKLTILLQELGGDIIFDKEFKVDKRANAFRMLLFLKDGIFQRELSNEEWDYLFGFFNLIYWGVVDRLKNDFSLTKHNIAFFCLLKCGFTNEEIGRIFVTNSDSVTKAKGRLKKQLKVSAEKDFDEFIRDY
ncbi:tetratricopeptide repeat protein [Oscillospiraceae bacterium N12]|jgi:tetratricopeptide (TPR) repeat protein|uniref:Tetratricopeptide repeat protein n=1 Tax=Jilunia laotingensis TaxID=2763675 RepID=A0A926F5F9_9BACT|nr:tetratricopeptide repeat protein [Jilunia laotingensis]MBC8595046.1 tetratricopeptide repeat protein [Jilunia laotingensis]